LFLHNSRLISPFAGGPRRRASIFELLAGGPAAASAAEPAVLFAEDSRGRTLLVGTAKHDPQPLAFRAADLVAADEVIEEKRG
jgi:hypothetical protein